MAIPGQRFNLNLDRDDWSFDLDENQNIATSGVAVNDVQERDESAVVAAPTLGLQKNGFPQHRTRKTLSSFKEKQVSRKTAPEPSDAAILHKIAQKHGVDLNTAREKQSISRENANRLADMTTTDIEEARAELMAQFNPEVLRKFVQRANIDDKNTVQEEQIEQHEAQRLPSSERVAFEDASVSIQPSQDTVADKIESEDDDASHPLVEPTSYPHAGVHFPGPPRRKEDYVPLDPSSATFLKDLREHYFPDLPHDPDSISWLAPPTQEESASYDPNNTSYLPSNLRFDFSGKLLTPTQAAAIPTSAGLHHHGDAPDVAGYTIPELGLLSRSTIPGQRCVAYQVLGRILFRLGRGDFGPRGGELQEALWSCIERERVVEAMMTEANRNGGGVHKSAQTYATEALWLWRRGGGGDRGVLKENERRAT